MQSKDLLAAYDDREGTFPEANYTDPIGVDRGCLAMIDSSSAENSVFELKKWIALDVFDVYALDSLANMFPSTATEVDSDDMNSMHDNFSRAKLLSDMFTHLRSGYEILLTENDIEDGNKRKKNRTKIKSNKIYYDSDNKELDTLHKLQDKQTVFIGINHMKIKPGQTFGDAATTSGGEGGKFDASIRLQIDYIKKSKEKDKYGRPKFKLIKITAKKNKVAPPFGSAEFLLWQDGRLTELDGSVSDDDMVSTENEVIEDNIVKNFKIKKK
jgi:RecA/RadA recombinase